MDHLSCDRVYYLISNTNGEEWAYKNGSCDTKYSSYEPVSWHDD